MAKLVHVLEGTPEITRSAGKQTRKVWHGQLHDPSRYHPAAARAARARNGVGRPPKRKQPA